MFDPIQGQCLVCYPTKGQRFVFDPMQGQWLVCDHTRGQRLVFDPMQGQCLVCDLTRRRRFVFDLILLSPMLSYPNSTNVNACRNLNSPIT